MGLPAESRRFNYGDYLTWPDDERYEIIHGVVYDMSPAPSPIHQGIVTELILQIGTYFKDKPCRVYVAPLDVRLPDADEPDEQIENVVQPDVLVICDRGKIDRRGCRGAPDLAIEVLSPSTARKDVREKMDLYESHGVAEYWLVRPEDKTVMVFRRGEDGLYGRPRVFAAEEKLPSRLFDGLVVDLALVFRE